MDDGLSWFNIQKKIKENKNDIYFHERQIWFCCLGLNIGNEQNGKGDEFLRPVIILKKFNNKIFIAIPLTTKIHKGKFYFDFLLNKNTRNTALLSQIKLLDSKRLKYRLGSIKKQDFQKLKEKLRKLIF